ncbi:hypothetical protein F6V30_14385 [Oryzomonas sagensis]|uniref:Uncharacterized protein n=1 Tax=Oryzomonas sagensis TaxID=2603857 RepID=A0ABQ6TLX3_9BACT|nr:hypothetical protein [Oryzomonas sagensis]KAB0669021.1 hypothetical protein F6V30_14385 [Oryzomonas sagensis]
MRKIIMIVAILTMTAMAAHAGTGATDITPHLTRCDAVAVIKTPIWQRLATAFIISETKVVRKTEFVETFGLLTVERAEDFASSFADKILSQNLSEIEQGRLFCTEDGSKNVLYIDFYGNGEKPVFSGRLLTDVAREEKR